MKFNPCVDLCTYDGERCEGCGRSREEITQTKAIVKSIVEFVQAQGYDNRDEFIAAIAKSATKKLAKLA
jgi:predicted Fe-S protein YdhL (DUF1289 family)